MNKQNTSIPYINPYWLYNVLKSSFTYSHFVGPVYQNIHIHSQTRGAIYNE